MYIQNVLLRDLSDILLTEKQYYAINSHKLLTVIASWVLPFINLCCERFSFLLENVFNSNIFGEARLSELSIMNLRLWGHGRLRKSRNIKPGWAVAALIWSNLKEVSCAGPCVCDEDYHPGSGQMTSHRFCLSDFLLLTSDRLPVFAESLFWVCSNGLRSDPMRVSGSVRRNRRNRGKPNKKLGFWIWAARCSEGERQQRSNTSLCVLCLVGQISQEHLD